MQEIKWTPEQQQVIDARNNHILVSAAAGSGKTAVLAERIIRRLTDEKMDIDRFLLVTFTDAAAAEMRDRIRGAIEKRLEEEEPESETGAHLQRQLGLLPSAAISTLHTFCLGVIRDHIQMVDISPDFRVMDDAEKALLGEDVMDEVLLSAYEEKTPEFEQCIETFRDDKSDKPVREHIRTLYNKARSVPDELKWLANCAAVYGVGSAEEMFELPWVEELVSYFQRLFTGFAFRAKDLLAICREENGPKGYAEAIEDDMRFFMDLSEADGYEAVRSLMEGHEKFRTLGSNRKYTPDPDKLNYAKNRREQYKKRYEKIPSQYFFDDPETLFEHFHHSGTAVKELLRLTEKYHEKYSEAKLVRGCIDFDDMEHFALKILEDGDTGMEYRRRYIEVMVDEYQDISAIQERLLDLITRSETGERNRFMVGDVKQSIYSFRLSRPELFMEKLDSFGKRVIDPGIRIDLSSNFRSRREIIDSCNAVFRSLMQKEAGGVIYDGAAELVYGGIFDDCIFEDQLQKTEIMLLDVNKDDAALTDEHQRVLEARMVAHRIAELTGHMMIKDPETKAGRPLRYGDITILLRTMKGWSEVFQEVLEEYGIPVYCETATGYFSATEVRTVLDYLRVLDNPYQDIPVTAVLTSPMGGFSAEDLAAVRLIDRKIPFYRCLESYRSSGSDPVLAAGIGDLLDQVERHREKMYELPLPELIRLILHETGYEYYLRALPGGERRKANINMLTEKAAQFEETGYKGVFHFLRYLDQLRSFDYDYGEASLESGMTDAVRIVSIHKSKGLEYPVVILAGLEKPMNTSDATGKLIVHPDLGAAAKDVDQEKRIVYQNIYRNYLQHRLMTESLGEELRVLYVAMTRAKEKLILAGCEKKPEEKLNEWRTMTWIHEQLPVDYVLACKTFLQMVMPAACRYDDLFTIDVRTIPDMKAREVVEFTEQFAREDDLVFWESRRDRFPVDAVLKDAVGTDMNRQYSYARLTRIKPKFSVSELKRQSMEEEFRAAEDLPGAFGEPAEVSGTIGKSADVSGSPAVSGGNTAAERGTAFHRFLELLDFCRVDLSDAEGSLAAQREEMISSGKLAREAADLLDMKPLAAFVSSRLGSRIRKAAAEGKVFRERRFMMEVGASEIYPEAHEDDTVLIQGVVDLYFEEDGEIVVVDYKTDRVRDASELVLSYKKQLELYARALSQGLDRPVKEQILYSLHLNREVRLQGR